MHKLLQWNCRGIHGKLSEFKNLIIDFDIICLQETWLKNKDIISIAGYLSVRQDRPSDQIGGGTAIFCRTELDPTVESLSGLKGLGIELSSISVNKISLNSKKLLVVSVYRPPDISVGRNGWNLFFNYMNSLSNNFLIIICGDFNTHHSSWESSLSNSEGTVLADILASSEFIFLNDGSPTRISANINLHSVPDLTICSMSLSSCCVWQLMEEAMGSDHTPIIVDITTHSSNTELGTFLCRPRLLLSNFVNDTFITLIDSKMKNVDSTDLNGAELYNLWHDLVLDCCLRAGAAMCDNKGNITKFDTTSNSIVLTRRYKRSGTLKRSKKPWWDKECDLAVDNRKRCYNNLIHNPNNETLSNYKKASSDTRKTLNKRRRINFHAFVDDISNNFSVGRFWDVISKFKKCPFNNSSDYSIPTTSRTSAIYSTIDQLAPFWANRQLDTVKPSNYNRLFDIRFFTQETKDLISCSRSNSSAGPDFINNYILKLLPDSALNILIEAFNRIILDGSYPSSWYNADTILIPKRGKSNKMRPISLTSCTLKLLEKLLKVRLERHVELELLLPNSQYGFRCGRSCDHCLAIINLEIYRAFSRKHATGALFLDVESAYDRVDLYILFNLINDMNIPIGYKLFLKNFLNPRYVKYYESGVFITQREVGMGLPQGAVLSPLLFNIFVGNILNHVLHSCSSIQFADDFVILTSGADPTKIIEDLSLAFSSISEWLSSIGLSLSIAKTQAIVFNRSKNIKVPDFITLNSVNVRLSQSVKYLGLLLDSGLRWHLHIKSIENRSLQYTNILKWIAGSSWGISPGAACYFINATVTSKPQDPFILQGKAKGTEGGKEERNFTPLGIYPLVGRRSKARATSRPHL